MESLADYGADYRNFVRELLLHFRELLLVKLAPAESPLLAQILPEERQELRPLAEALSEEDLLRVFDVLTKAESELRQVTDPRVAVELALLKLVQMRRLVPFAELVARVERLAGGALAAPAPQQRDGAALAPRVGARRGPPPLLSGRSSTPPRPAAASPATPPQREADAGERATPGVGAGGLAAAIVAAMIGQCQGRPSLAAPLRGRHREPAGRHAGARAAVRLPRVRAGPRPGVPALARQAAGRALALRIEAGAVAPVVETPTPEAERRQKLREEAEKEPAVQEALDLFDGRVVDVREAMPGREDA